MKRLVIFLIASAFSTANADEATEKIFREAQKVYVEEIEFLRDRLRGDKLKGLIGFFENEEKRIDQHIRDISDDLELSLLRFIRENTRHDYTPYAMFQLASLYFQLGEKEAHYYSQAEHYLQALTKEHRTFGFLEESYYLLAYSQLQQEKEKNAIQTFRQLLKQYPKSRFIEEARVRIGEYFFHRELFDKALPFYQSIVNNRQSPFYFKALYKSAWAFYLTKRYTAALQRFLEINSTGKESEFFAESSEYVAFCLYRLDRGVATINVLRQRGWNDQSYGHISRYAQLLVADGRFRTAAAIYQRLNREFPEHPEASETIFRAANALLANGDTSEAIQLERLYLKRFPEKNSRRKQILFHIASYKYALWQKDRSAKDAIVESQRAFAEIFTDYPGTIEAYQSQFYASEAAFIVGDYERAVQGYKRVISNPTYNKHFAAALRSIVVCQEKRLEKAKDKLEKRTVALELLESLDDYLARGDLTDEQPKILFRSGQVFLVLEDNKSAIERFAKLLNWYPQSDLATASATQILDTLIKAKQWAQVVDWAEFLETVASFTQLTDFIGKIRNAEFDARYSLAQEAKTRSELATAAAHYMNIVRRFPEKENADQILLHVARLFRQQGQIRNAINIYRKFLKSYPESSMYQDAVFELSNLSIKLYWFAEALEVLKQLVTKQNAQAAYRVGQIYEFVGNQAAAIRHYDLAAQWTKDRKLQRSSLLKLVTLLEKSGRSAEALQTSNRLVRLEPTTTHLMSTCRIAVKTLPPNSARRYCRRLGKPQQFRQPSEAVQYHLYYGQLWESYFAKSPLLKRGVVNEAKLVYLERAEVAYLQAIKTNAQPWSHQGLFHIANMYQELSSLLLEAAKKDLSQQLYKKSIDLYDKLVEESHKNQIYTVWTQKALEKLHQSQSNNRIANLNYRIIEDDTLYTPPLFPVSGASNRQEKAELENPLLVAALTNNRQQITHSRNFIDDELALQQAVNTLPGDAKVLLNAALLLYPIGHKQTAKDILERVPTPGEWPISLVVRGNIDFTLRNYQLAAKNYRQYLTLYPGTLEVQLNLASAYLKLKRYNSAIAILRQLRGNGWHHPRIPVLVARYFDARGEEATALSIVSNALEDFPQDLSLQGLFISLSLTQGGLADCLPFLETKPTPDNPYFINQIGRLYYYLGNHSKGSSWLATAANLKQDTDLLYNLALLQHGDGKSEAARSTYQTYLQRGGKPDKLAEVL